MAKQKTYTWKDPSGPLKLLFGVMGLNIAARVASLAVAAVYGPAAVLVSGEEVLNAAQAMRALADVTKFAVTLISIAAGWWVYRANANAHTFRPKLINSPFGAVAWYIVPLAGLYKPYQAMRETWAASALTGERGRDGILRYWWGIYLASNVVATLANMPALSSISFFPAVVSDLLAIGCSVMLIQVARIITRMQLAKHASRVFSDAEPPPPNVLERLTEGV